MWTNLRTSHSLLGQTFTQCRMAIYLCDFLHYPMSVSVGRTIAMSPCFGCFGQRGVSTPSILIGFLVSCWVGFALSAVIYPKLRGFFGGQYLSCSFCSMVNFLTYCLGIVDPCFGVMLTQFTESHLHFYCDLRHARKYTLFLLE